MVLDGLINGDWFEAYVTPILVADLKPGDVVIMDNLLSYKRASVRELIEETGATLRLLPPYSPDFNPIGKAGDPQNRHFPDEAKAPVDAVWDLGRCAGLPSMNICIG